MMSFLKSNIRTSILLLGCLIAYGGVMTMFLREGHPSFTMTGVPSDAFPFDVNIISIDLLRDNVEMTFLPDASAPPFGTRGHLVDEVSLEIDTGSSVFSRAFKAGETPQPWQVAIPIEEGDQLEYPFDVHTGDFTIKATRKGGVSGPPDLDLNKVNHGYRFAATGEVTPDKTQLTLAYTIRRAPGVMTLAIMAIISLTLVVLSAVNVAWQVSKRGRKVEFSMMVWVAAMMFVIPAVRNGLPGAPPPGALIDIGLFFWLNMTAAGVLLVIVYCWSNQKA